MVIISTNPATLEENGRVDETPVEALDDIVQLAKVAQREWRSLEVTQRARIVVKVNEYLAKNIDEISTLISTETGKPTLEAFVSEVYGAMDAGFYYYTIAPEVLEKKEEINLGFYNSLQKTSYVMFKPAGIVGVIGPYNYPFAIPFSQTLQSLIAGNAVIFKPSSDTVLTGQKIQEVFDSVDDLPRNLMTTVYGDGPTVGNGVVERVNRVIFTGSTETGKRIMQKAAERLTPVCLELGGKSEMIILPDANMDRAVLAARWGCFTNSGQVCSSVKRLFLHEGIASEFTTRLVELTKQLRQGNPLDPDVDVGAMVNEAQMNKVLQAIDLAISEGAEVLCGGRRNPNFDGYFIEPTILGKCTNSMQCVQREIFGPVLPIVAFQTEDEAIEMANDNPYGLTSSIWTNDIERGTELAKRLETGTAMVNEVVYTFALSQTPWGGVKSSGIGRTHGKFGFMEVVDPFHLNVDTYAEPDAWWMPYDKDFASMMENFKLIAKSLVVKD
ncbi:MAG TPA: aldehyde dehydrogenase family protein [Candidatus Lokiarchaeia archaeon]|nr:aldehyde dehydrogenase family protein [Candidatus Lokiarchaeia archaeon]